MKRKDRTAEKASADPQAVQRGRLRSAAPFGLVFRVVCFRGVCLSRRREAAPLSYQRQAHATVANCFFRALFKGQLGLDLLR